MSTNYVVSPTPPKKLSMGGVRPKQYFIYDGMFYMAIVSSGSTSDGTNAVDLQDGDLVQIDECDTVELVDVTIHCSHLPKGWAPND